MKKWTDCIFCQQRPNTGKEFRELYLSSRFLSSKTDTWLCDRCKIYVLAYLSYKQLPMGRYILWRLVNFLDVRR